MAPKSLKGLAKLLVKLKLVDFESVERCMAEFGMSRKDPSDLLRLLESRSLLTSYQVAQLEKGEAEGLVLGNCKLLYRNAAGSFARVFRAEDLSTGKMVGLKLLRQRWAKDKKAVQQFHREAEVCKRLVHKNIVPIYDIGKKRDYHFFTMEFVEGGNLRDFITIRKRLAPPEAVKCVMDMAEGLEYALKMGLTHRDLKLTNVLMAMDGVAKLVDFGLAGEEGSGGGLNSGDGVPRALEYATLEKGTGAPNNDPRSDLFFLGTIFYELLTGVPPYPRTRSREERKQLSRYSHVRSIREVDPTVDSSLSEVVERLMALNPNERYQSATELLQDLRPLYQTLNASSTVSTRHVPPAPRADASTQISPAGSVRKNLPTVMCIESRPKHQDILREYLSKHGYRVLMLSDVQRGIQRMQGDETPDCVVLMGESIGDQIVAAFQELVKATQNGRTVGLAVFSKKQKALRSECTITATARILIQPVTLRDLRREIHIAFQALKKNSRQPAADALDSI
ncbi:MAG: serine/threonine-protein kinase [Planctomycetaceae bacterium]